MYFARDKGGRGGGGVTHCIMLRVLHRRQEGVCTKRYLFWGISRDHVSRFALYQDTLRCGGFSFVSQRRLFGMGQGGLAET